MDNVREKAISAICSRIGDGEGVTPSVEAIANNYASDVFRQYHGLRFVRQVINVGAEKYELLHIFIFQPQNT